MEASTTTTDDTAAPAEEIGRLLARAQEAARAGRIDEAEPLFDAVATSGVRASEGWYGLGFVHATRGNDDEARRCFVRALAADPTNADAAFQIGFLYQRAGRLDAARAQYYTALAIGGDHQPAVRALAALPDERLTPPRTAAPATPITEQIRPQEAAAPAVGPGARTDVCPRCGAVPPAGSRFCDRCGSAIGAPSTTSPAGVAAPVPRVTVRPPRPPADPRSLVGVVVSVQQRTEGYRFRPAVMTVYDFRVQPYGPDGQELPIEAVHMRGMRIKGAVAQGDWIEVPARSRGREGYEPRRIRNLTTGSVLETSNYIIGS